jgi:hypothetical protein
MFAGIRRAFGAIKVTETTSDIQVTGIPADVLARDISKLWNTSRINAWMFTSLGKNAFSFPKFFAVEVHYMLQQLDEYRYSKSSVRTIRHILSELETNTWLKRLSEENEDGTAKTRMDLTQLSKLNAKLFPHQDGFLKAYGELTERYGLRGYLLAADPGTGKTIMGLAAAECLHADLVVIVSPKNALNRVWTSTIDWLYKKPQPYWVAAGDKPYNHERIIVTHYEALAKALAAAKTASHNKAVVILDESHNLNEAKSNRTQLFLELCTVLKCENVLWSSGTPLKAMGYEVVPLLRSIDPLFTPDVETRFLKIFGKASDRALDILRNRIGKASFHVSGAEVIDVTTSEQSIKIEVPGSEKYTLEAIRAEMREFVEQRMAYYMKNFKQYQRMYDDGLAAFEKVMTPEQGKDLAKYRKVIKLISAGYDPEAHKEEAMFANTFETKTILPALKDKTLRDGFKHSRSVIKYVALKVMGEALGGVVGKARAQCHIDMVPHIDWKKIADQSAKKVLVFTSYVEVVKAVQAQLEKDGFKSLAVYGETNSNVAGIVSQFGKDDEIKFLVATYQSLSTAVPMTMADETVFVNQPFRSFEKDQAQARTARIGQDSPCLFVNTFLDTGKEPNISTRSRDILDWSREQVDAMMGGLKPPGAAAELNKDYNKGALEAYQEHGTNFTPAFENLVFDNAVDNAFGENDRPELVTGPALETFMNRADRKDGLGRRILIRALGMFAYLPELTFDRDDVNMGIVEKMLKHPDLLKVVDEWIFEPKPEYVPRMWEVKKAFSSYQKPSQYKKIYRGFSPSSLDQETMGLSRQGFFGGRTSAEFQPGDKFNHVTQRPLSFTHHEGTANVFGGVVISIDPAKYANQLLDISPELCYAIMRTDMTEEKIGKLPYYVTYGELVLLPSDKPIEFVVESINKKK